MTNFMMEHALQYLEDVIREQGVAVVVEAMSEDLRQQLWVALSGPNEPEMD